MKDLLLNKLSGKRVLILGYGREGASTRKLLRAYFPEMPLSIADKNEQLKQDFVLSQDKHLTLITGENYLASAMQYDVIIKSPGISLKDNTALYTSGKISSQTDLFIQQYHAQMIGVTGTKGKSTASSLIHHILKSTGKTSVLCGNIGIPLFDIVPAITPETIVVAELSSHQLEFLTTAPDVSVLLNLFQEHLDHYNSLQDYHQAKLNIGIKQVRGSFIYHKDDEKIASFLATNKIQANGIPFDATPVFREKILTSLKGEHNELNIKASALAAMQFGVSESDCLAAIATFKALPHRMEYIGAYKEIHFYNDSISTIPEATIQSVTALKDVDTLILGGFDRGIDYTPLVDFIGRSSLKQLIYIGEAGKRIRAGVDAANLYKGKQDSVEAIAQAVDIAFKQTAAGRICLLSPAAASYDQFKNFEERGETYRALVSQ